MVLNQESLQANINKISFTKKIVNISPNKIGLKESIDWVFKNYSNIIKNPIPIIDNSMQVNGSFFWFCRDNKYKVEPLCVDSFALLYSEPENEESFISQGVFLVQKDNFKFIKCSIMYKAYDNTDQISSFVIVDKKEYDKYVEFKNIYSKWTKNKDGIIVKLIGGDDYLLDNCYTWNSLFYSEKDELKNDIKNYINNFLNSKDLYLELNIPYKTCMLINGLPGCGKTELINTIICEHELNPVTINDSIDNSLLEATFNYAATKEKCVLFIEDIDELINEGIIDSNTIPRLLDSFDNINCNNGLIILLSATKLPDDFNDIIFKFDKRVDLDYPEYDKSIEFLFSKFFSKNLLDTLKEDCKSNNISYGYIERLYNSFSKNMLTVKCSIDNEKEHYDELKKILKNFAKENNLINNKYLKTSKKLGLSSKARRNNNESK